MKHRKLLILSSLMLVSVLASCGGGENPSSNPVSEEPSVSESLSETPTSEEEVVSSEEEAKPTNKAATIYLAGDSTVKTYGEKQYIGGWGQFLDRFLSSEMKVANCSNGGRSSRSFINEGRLYDNPGSNYTFSENGGNSIGDVIKEGDFLMIQFGHNDDSTKMASSYSTIYDRMVPLGEPDENGIYPTTPGEKTTTTVLPEEYTNKATDAEETTALSTIAKYGETYYAFDSGGTYKWFLKQYIDFAREKGATPVLVTPVARVKFSGNEIIGGAGLHGANFAYVQAVRQLAAEENCLLIDLFADSKEMLETATSTYANYLMALKPNDLTGEWPAGYDEAYGNTELGYTGIEATHYNKYGAFLQAAKVAEAIINSNEAVGENNSEYYSFKDFVLNTPESYIDPSNLISKSKVAEIEALFDTVSVTNPNRVYANPQEVVDAIDALNALGEMTNDNYLTYKEKCEEIREMYYKLNVDDRAAVTNLSTLEAIEAQVESFIEANRPKPISTTVINFENLTAGTFTEDITGEGYVIHADTSKNVEIKESKATATYNGTQYSTTKLVKLGGSASYGTGRYISFEVTGKCTISVMAKSSSSSEERVINLVNSSYSAVGSLPAPISAAFSSVDVEEAGTYSLGSTSGGVYIYTIVIEYFA